MTTMAFALDRNLFFGILQLYSNLRVGYYRPSSWSYSGVHCTACDCEYIKI